MSIVAENDTSDSNPDDSNAFISKILGEMKSQFNKTDKKVEEKSVSDSNTEENFEENMTECTTQTNGTCEVKEDFKDENVKLEEKPKSQLCTNENTVEVKSEDKLPSEDIEAEDGDGKPRLVMLFKRPNNENAGKLKSKPEELPAGRRSLRNKSNSTEEKVDQTTLKRSARRRSKDCNESVLQSAIARKEKSYNESAKPQRLTRQLKPTPKILENLALAKQEKGKIDKSKSQRGNDKNKTYDSDSNNDTVSSDTPDEKPNKKIKLEKTTRKNSKRAKYNNESRRDSDSDIDSNPSCSNGTKNNENSRRSQRILSNFGPTFWEYELPRSSQHSLSRCKEDESVESDEPQLPEPTPAESASLYPADPECSSVSAQLIASRLCLCTQRTNMFPASKDEVIYCGAVDSVGTKLLGCSRTIDKNTTVLLRPSNRVPYTLFCEVHVQRLIRHNCCPTCGVFLTSGCFVQCESRHHYHRDCQISVGNIECCPHCGSLTPNHDVYISMQSPMCPVILTKQQPHSTTNVTTG